MEIQTHVDKVLETVKIIVDKINHQSDKIIEETIHKITFAEAVGSQQVKTIATNAKIDIMKDDQNVQRLGAELLNN